VDFRDIHSDKRQQFLFASKLLTYLWSLCSAYNRRPILAEAVSIFLLDQRMRRFVAVLCFLTCEIVGQIETTTILEESTTTSIAATTTATTTKQIFTSSEIDEVASSTIEASVQLSLSDLALPREVSNDDEILKNIAKEKLYDIFSSK